MERRIFLFILVAGMLVMGCVGSNVDKQRSTYSVTTQTPLDNTGKEAIISIKHLIDSYREAYAITSEGIVLYQKKEFKLSEQKFSEAAIKFEDVNRRSMDLYKEISNMNIEKDIRKEIAGFSTEDLRNLSQAAKYMAYSAERYKETVIALEKGDLGKAKALHDMVKYYGEIAHNYEEKIQHLLKS